MKAGICVSLCSGSFLPLQVQPVLGFFQPLELERQSKHRLQMHPAPWIPNRLRPRIVLVTFIVLWDPKNGFWPGIVLAVDIVLAQNIVLSLPNDTEAKKSKKCTRTMLTRMGKIASFTRFCSSFLLDPTGAKNRTFRFWGLRAGPGR